MRCTVTSMEWEFDRILDQRWKREEWWIINFVINGECGIVIKCSENVTMAISEWIPAITIFIVGHCDTKLTFFCFGKFCCFFIIEFLNRLIGVKFHLNVYIILMITLSIPLCYNIDNITTTRPNFSTTHICRDITMGVLLRTRKAILEGGYGGHPPAVIWLDPLHPQNFCVFFVFFYLRCPFFVKQGPPETPLKVPLTSYKVSNWCYKVSLWGPKVSYPPSRYHLYRFFWNFFFHFLKTHNIIHNSLNVKCKLVIDHYIY